MLSAFKPTGYAARGGRAKPRYAGNLRINQTEIHTGVVVPNADSGHDAFLFLWCPAAVLTDALAVMDMGIRLQDPWGVGEGRRVRHGLLLAHAARGFAVGCAS